LWKGNINEGNQWCWGVLGVRISLSPHYYQNVCFDEMWMFLIHRVVEYFAYIRYSSLFFFFPDFRSPPHSSLWSTSTL
jgi:hypothetical protein